MSILPISGALAEAYPDSISELYSRDIESLTDSDIDRIISDQRANRERMEAAEALGKRAPREPKPKSVRESNAPAPSGLKIEGLKL